MRTTSNVALALALIGGAAACGKQQKPELPPPVTATPTPAPPREATPPAAAPARDAAAEAAARRATLEARIHFDFDRWDLTAEARRILAAKAPILLGDRSITLRIEGHADERGSDEYNLVLSNRRAAEAKRYLVEQGVGGERLQVMGLGEEQPLDARTGEQSWALNRRAEFRVTGGQLIADR